MNSRKLNSKVERLVQISRKIIAFVRYYSTSKEKSKKENTKAVSKKVTSTWEERGEKLRILKTAFTTVGKLRSECWARKIERERIARKFSATIFIGALAGYYDSSWLIPIIAHPANLLKFIKMQDSKYIQEVKQQLECLQDINSYISNGENILHQTVKRCGRVEVVKYLLKRGANVHSTTDSGKNVIILAVSSVNKNNYCSIMELVKFLIDKKVSVVASDGSGDCALHHLIKNCKSTKQIISLAELLIQSGARVNAINKCGESALYLAVGYRDLSLSKYLVSAGASLYCRRKQIKSALELTVEKCDLKMTELLMRICKRPKKLTNNQSSLLHIAIKSTRPGKERRDLIKTLLNGGADPNVCDSSSLTPLHRVLWEKDEDCAKILIDHGCIIDCEDGFKDTPLRIAVREQLRYSVELLLLKGADPNNVKNMHVYRNMYGSVASKESIMCDAIWRDDSSIVQLLWMHGVNRSSKEDVSFFLGLSARCNNIARVKFFLSKGADINFAIGLDPFNPLLAALCPSENVPENMVQFLIDNGADVLTGNPIDFARKYNRFDRGALCLIRHYALLTIGNPAICEDILRQFENSTGYTNYFFSCVFELSQMQCKDKIPLSNFTPYEVLIKKDDELVKCIQNQSVVNFIKSDEASTFYPRYSWNLRYRLAQGRERLNLINKSRVFFSIALPSSIPVEIVTLISEHLSNEDLMTLSKIHLKPREIPKKFTITLREARKRKYVV
ncbi:hypothetical protein QAD02_010989 [Eretmocerus hayati]|uniref:Uncharacterized protein n=1 Tax=Eretmocerus hayati TaxID=131215 RepID=A0ACC2NVI6_9HYME|nr:hypothetical protein QAD02_010989 [Eretmocerus hayati]